MTYGKRDCVISLLVSAGLILSLSSIVTFFLSPYLIQHIVRQKLVLSSHESNTFPGWSKPPVPIYTKFYIFNVTNPQEVVNGSDVKLQEIGPYTFLEKREKINITWKHTQGTVSYRQIKRYYFVPEKTQGSLNDLVYHLNVPLTALIHRALTTPDEMLKNLINKITEDETQNHLFLQHTVEELLFEGYDDPFLEWANSENLLPIPLTRFGWFYGRNGTATDGEYTIYTGEDNQMEKFGMMFSWNSIKKLEFWNDSVTSQCNQLETTWPGDLRPPYPDQESTSLRLFLPELCRWMNLSYLKRTETLGVDTIRYWAAPTLFDYNIPDNKCYCIEDNCPANGIFNTSLCNHGSPSSISFPNFLYADSSYSKHIEGLNPDPNKHIFYMDIEPNLGIAVETVARFQVNIFLAKDSEIYVSSELADSLHIPMFWFETSAKISPEMINQIQLLHKQVPKMITIGSVIQIGFAVVLLLATIIYALYPASLKQLVKPPMPISKSRPLRKEYKSVMTTSFQS